MKVHYSKLYNMTHLLSLNTFTASKGSNNYILFNLKILFPSDTPVCNFDGKLLSIMLRREQIGNDQEKAQSEKDSNSKNRGGKNQINNQALIFIPKPNVQLLTQKVTIQLPKLNLNMKTYIRRQQHKTFYHQHINQ